MFSSRNKKNVNFPASRSLFDKRILSMVRTGFKWFAKMVYPGSAGQGLNLDMVHHSSPERKKSVTPYIF